MRNQVMAIKMLISIRSSEQEQRTLDWLRNQAGP
jgi:hypothetical protein